MLPYDEWGKNIKNNEIKQLSQGVQNFYNGSCFDVMIDSTKNLDEVLNLLEKAYQEQE